jgi:hypothetical protein
VGPASTVPGRGLNSVQTDSKILIGLKIDSNLPNFAWPKRCLPLLQKLEIKYGWREFEIMNNFSLICFLRFEIDIELKFREASMS